MLVVQKTRFPAVDQKIGLGLGMDLQWQSERGFLSNPDRLAEPTRKFLQAYQGDFQCLFFSFQRKNNNILKSEDYQPAYDDLLSYCGDIAYISLHHTRLNMASCTPYKKEQLIQFTNELVKRYELRWINEDLGFWSLMGKILPYPLPPLLTESGLQACIGNINEYQQGLAVPLLVEFPSFAQGSHFRPGPIEPLEYFNRIINATNSASTFDTAHILSYQWMNGLWGDNLLVGLEKLPFESCFEIHLSGCEIQNNQFMDFHHGILLDEQLQLLEYLLKKCPNLKVVTYEDPVFNENGQLIDACLDDFNKLKLLVNGWL